MKNKAKSIAKKLHIYDDIVALLHHIRKSRITALNRAKKIIIKKDFSFGGYVLLLSDKLVVTHNAGFFSCCTARLANIVEYYDHFGITPEKINSQKQFVIYKRPQQAGQDIIDYYFNRPKSNISIEENITADVMSLQGMPYSQLDLNVIIPFIDKYFSLEAQVLKVAEELIATHRFDFSNTCCICYRGNDKATETNLPTYQDVYEKVCEIREKNPGIVFLVQTDEEELYAYLDAHMPGYICMAVTKPIAKTLTSGVPYQKDRDVFKESLGFLAALKVLSNCEHVICTTSNVWLWMIFFRGHTRNINQYISHKKIVYGSVNPQYLESPQQAWYT